ncbi:hypothetical protein H6784_05645 [Candidatus Nomurabacteria bacterium]|nr:hypothetical protein [Candidatus Nomurabacteria bacterium]
MSYAIGKEVCLWQERVEAGKVTVLKEVIVRITEIKTGVPGEFSRNPQMSQSLRGIGDDGNVYEKHWNYWPEAQIRCFDTQWSMRDDGAGEHNFWIPKEAVYAYNELKYFVKHCCDSDTIVRVDTKGQPIIPKGDCTYCEKHDEFHYSWQECFRCSMENRQKTA